MYFLTIPVIALAIYGITAVLVRTRVLRRLNIVFTRAAKKFL